MIASSGRSGVGFYLRPRQYISFSRASLRPRRVSHLEITRRFLRDAAGLIVFVPVPDPVALRRSTGVWALFADRLGIMLAGLLKGDTGRGGGDHVGDPAPNTRCRGLA